MGSEAKGFMMIVQKSETFHDATTFNASRASLENVSALVRRKSRPLVIDWR